MTELLAHLTSWISTHPNLAGFAIFWVAFSESMAFVGLLVPGAALMVSAGALIATGTLSFWPTMAWAVAGAMMADGISFWLGHHYREDIRSFRFMRKHPHMLVHGERFFHRHGGKSVFIGRFVGPVRPVIPIVAGMLGMRPLRFTLYNILSALLWAPAYLLPGMAFGASLALAGEVAGRLALLLGVSLFGCWLVFSLSHRLVRYLLHRFPVWEDRLLQAVLSSPLLHRWLGGLLIRELPLLRPIMLLVALFFAADWIFLRITRDVIRGQPLDQLDQYFYHLFRGLRTPWGDTLMIGMTMTGDAAVTMTLVAVACCWLLWKRDTYSARFLAVTVTGGYLLVYVMKNITRIPRPSDVYQGLVHWAFPSSHATMSVVVFGFLALLCGRELAAHKRWLPGTLAILLISGIGISRLYLGAHWFTDVAAGYALGTVWLILFAVGYFHRVRPCSYQGLCRVVAVFFVLITGVHWIVGFDADRVRYLPREREQVMSFGQWRTAGWQQLPVARRDLEGKKEQFFNLQYAGTLSWLLEQLTEKDWRQPVPLTLASSLHWLVTDPDPMSLPVLPQVHDAHHEVLLLVHSLAGSTRSFLALRLWPAGIEIDGGKQLYVGTVTRMEVRNYLGLISLPRTRAVVPVDRVMLLADTEEQKVLRADGRPVLLLWQAEKNGDLKPEPSNRN